MSNNIEDIENVNFLIRTLKADNYNQAFINSLENILADRKRLIEENNKNKDALEILNKMKRKYKIALFMVIRNSTVLPKGIELQKSSKEISQMSYKTMCEILTMIDFKTAEKMYKEGKSK